MSLPQGVKDQQEITRRIERIAQELRESVADFWGWEKANLERAAAILENIVAARRGEERLRI